jgi:translation elongation factor EF-G
MDAAVDYLPSPSDRSTFPACSLPAHTWADHQNGKNLVALAFKVVHDKQKGIEF